MFHSTVIVSAFELCNLSDFLPSLCLQQHIDCGLNLPLTERQCLVHAKQDGYTMKSHGNVREKVSVFLFFFSLKVIEATFCVGVKTKRPTRTLS